MFTLVNRCLRALKGGRYLFWFLSSLNNFYLSFWIIFWIYFNKDASLGVVSNTVVRVIPHEINFEKMYTSTSLPSTF